MPLVIVAVAVVLLVLLMTRLRRTGSSLCCPSRLWGVCTASPRAR